jgi:hypothetical protein
LFSKPPIVFRGDRTECRRRSRLLIRLSNRNQQTNHNDDSESPSHTVTPFSMRRLRLLFHDVPEYPRFRLPISVKREICGFEWRKRGAALISGNRPWEKVRGPHVKPCRYSCLSRRTSGRVCTAYRISSTTHSFNCGSLHVRKGSNPASCSTNHRATATASSTSGIGGISAMA